MQLAEEQMTGNTLGVYRSEVSQCPAGADGVCLVSDVCACVCVSLSGVETVWVCVQEFFCHTQAS